MPDAFVSDYFYGDEAEQFIYFRIPRQLITNPRFKHLSTDSKLLYGMLLDRMGLSVKNEWYDDAGRVYIYYTVEEICDDMNCGRDKAMKLLAELDTGKGVGLIERRRQGQGKPTRIYVKRFTTREIPPRSKKQPDPPPRPQEVDFSDVQKSDFPTSRSREYRRPEVEKSDPNKNNKNQTDFSHTDPSTYPPAPGAAAANEPSKTPAPQMIPLSKIHEVPGVFNAKPQDKALGGLVSSIQSGGVKEPVILRDRGDGEYQLLNGYCRRRASELAKLQEVPALVYEMTLQEAIAYRKAVKDRPDTPIPGKLVDPNADKGKAAKKPAEAVNTDAADKDGKEKQDDAPATPAAEGKDAEKPAEAVKTDTADKDSKEKQGDTPTAPAAEGKDAKKPAEAVKADTADKDGKDAEKSGKEDKPAEKQGETEHKPTVAELEAQAKAGKPVNITDIMDAQQREREAKRTAEAEKGKLKGTLRPSDAEAKRMEKKAPAVEKSADAPALERAAEGPAGTAISQIFDKRLDPPDEAAFKSLPVPQEGESFFITLHPAYLEKSEYNTFSVDTQSENFKELLKSVELVGIKDPVLARFGKEGKLEILSGQRRHLAATMLNQAVPTIIQKIDDADAKIMVADGNLHRGKISSYDLSRALRMKMEGMKQKAGRRKKGYNQISIPKNTCYL